MVVESSHLDTTVRQRELNGNERSLQSQTPAHGIVPPSFRADLLTLINLI